MTVQQEMKIDKRDGRVEGGGGGGSDLGLRTSNGRTQGSHLLTHHLVLLPESCMGLFERVFAEIPLTARQLRLHRELVEGGAEVGD